MDNPVRVEMPIIEGSELLLTCKTIGDVEKKFPELKLVKYIYVDPYDSKLKGVNPPSNTPLVQGAYITVMGDLDIIIRFATMASK